MEMGVSQYNPSSFSSSLLDAIYRSIDRADDGEMVIYGESAGRERDHANVRGVCRSGEEKANFRRACMTEKWMEKYSSEKTSAVLQMKKPRKSDRKPESSRCNSCDFGGFFSPGSEPEPFPLPRPKPVRTGASGLEEGLESNRRGSDPNSKIIEGGGGFVKTKSRALKIYSDLKKARQPISPGSKLAGFLYSLFTVAGKPKPTGAIRSHHSPSPKSIYPSTCSSASSLSRSCLSKTPSSRVKSSRGPKRSVRFSPVAATPDNDSHKSTHESKIYTTKVTTKTDDCYRSIRNAINEELMALILEKNHNVEEEVAKDLLKNYRTKTQPSFPFEFSFDSSRKSRVQNQSFDLDFEDIDDDLASCASSDLFELDNLSVTGTEKYSHELPVYETTHRSVANGFIF